MHRYVRRAGVANDICQGLLKNAKKSRIEIWMQARMAQVGVNVAFNAGSRLEFIRLPFQRGRQAKMIQYAGPQLGRYPADHLNR